MTTLELQQWKKVVSTSPVAFSIEEACKEIDIAEKELQEGKGINEAEMRQFFGEWKKKLQ